MSDLDQKLYDESPEYREACRQYWATRRPFEAADKELHDLRERLLAERKTPTQRRRELKVVSS